FGTSVGRQLKGNGLQYLQEDGVESRLLLRNGHGDTVRTPPHRRPLDGGDDRRRGVWPAVDHRPTHLRSLVCAVCYTCCVTTTRQQAEHEPIARVLPMLSVPHLDREFDYLVSAEQSDDAQPGVRVRVRFH